LNLTLFKLENSESVGGTFRDICTQVVTKVHFSDLKHAIWLRKLPETLY